LRNGRGTVGPRHLADPGRATSSFRTLEVAAATATSARSSGPPACRCHRHCRDRRAAAVRARRAPVREHQVRLERVRVVQGSRQAGDAAHRAQRDRGPPPAEIMPAEPDRFEPACRPTELSRDLLVSTEPCQSRDQGWLDDPIPTADRRQP
jgi:hypothetical protein